MTNESKSMRTLGGLQFWSDVFLYRDLRIQQNVLTGHYRLLDGRNRRLTWGTEEHCRAKLAEIRSANDPKPLGGKAVLFLHGLVRTRNSMSRLSQQLESAGFVTYQVGYPSTRLSIERHAKNLNRIVSGLTDAKQVHFVTHSMGGLVVRAYLAKDADPRIGRLVMLAAPNQGAVRADAWKENIAYRIVAGPAGQQLVTGQDGIALSLPITPAIEFGIIAGGKGDEKGYSPRIPGDDDGTVAVANTRLPGARDFALVQRRHTFIMNSEEVCRMTASFLAHGYFRSEKERQPIEPKGESEELDG